MSIIKQNPIRVLFVCLGNICRSPMAEAVFAHKVAAAGLSAKIVADSAGTGSWHIGEPPHKGTLKLLAEKRIDYQHRARQFRSADHNDFDYVLTMDDDNLRMVGRVGKGTATIKPFLDYAPGTRYTEVPDPWYTGNFEEVYELVSEASDGLLSAIRREHNL